LRYLPLILAKVAVGVEVAEAFADKTIEDNFLKKTHCYLEYLFAITFFVDLMRIFDHYPEF
jgi:hypothetical protein